MPPGLGRRRRRLPKERGRPWEGAAGRGAAGGGMRWDGFPLECELGMSLPK